MENKDKEKSPFQNLMHIGLIVRDAENTAKRLEFFGLGKYAPMTGKPSLEGKPADDKVKGFLAKIGDVEIELFQPGSVELPWQEFMKKKTDGIHHIGFLVNDIDGDMKKLAEKGYKPVSKGEAEGQSWADYDLGYGGCVVQLIQR